MENTKISIELEKWQVVALRNYFGQNDKTQVAHWAFSVFDESLKSNHKSTSQKETIERLRTAFENLYDAAFTAVSHVALANYQSREIEAKNLIRTAYDKVEQLLSTTEPTEELDEQQIEDRRIEELTERNVKIVGDFMEHCESEGLIIPDHLYESYFNA